MKKILVLCTGNSCRSQIAHGYLDKILINKAKIYSAGIETHGLNTYAVKIMKMDGVNIDDHTSNLVDEYFNEFFKNNVPAWRSTMGTIISSFYMLSWALGARAPPHAHIYIYIYV